MRVVSGALRGLRLETVSEDGIRPTTDRVKESIFNILQFQISGKRFLDLFGGSGQIGIEAASRGAEEVFIVENNPKAQKIIRKNIGKLEGKFEVSLFSEDALKFLSGFSSRFGCKLDIVFLDPPYDSDFFEEISESVDEVMDEDGLIVTETDSRNKTRESIGKFDLKKSYKYGRTVIGVYKLRD